MNYSSIPIKFAFFFSLSLAGAASFATNNRKIIKCVRPKATVSDLLSLLGPPQQAQSVNSRVAQELSSCFKFLVPFNRTADYNRRSLRSELATAGDDVILTPPPAVLELARLAVDSGGDPAAIHRALDPTVIHVPNVEGSNEDRCELTRTPYGRRFINEELNSYLEYLFEIIVERGPSVGLNVSLSRYDLFHGHLFIAAETSRLGIFHNLMWEEAYKFINYGKSSPLDTIFVGLMWSFSLLERFHAKEYPAYDKAVFPYNMGYCQVGSNVAYDDSMNLRNILWLAPMAGNSTTEWLTPGVLVVLDAHPDGIIYQDLIPEYVDLVRTLYEEDFGELVLDVNYLNVGAKEPKFQIFLC